MNIDDYSLVRDVALLTSGVTHPNIPGAKHPALTPAAHRVASSAAAPPAAAAPCHTIIVVPVQLYGILCPVAEQCSCTTSTT